MAHRGCVPGCRCNHRLHNRQVLLCLCFLRTRLPGRPDDFKHGSVLEIAEGSLHCSGGIYITRLRGSLRAVA
eukprot:15466866-Alexandrium_andersonii.AAC.1